MANTFRASRLLATVAVFFCVTANATVHEMGKPQSALPGKVPEIQFQEHGKVVASLNAVDLAKDFEVTKVTVFDANEQDKVTYEGVKFNAVLDKVYGDRWKKNKNLIFKCLDGYKPIIPVKRFEDFGSYIALHRVHSAEFVLINKNEKGAKSKLAPFYLVWDNVKQPESKATDNSHYWPYQISVIDLLAND